jgi:pyridoxamine 5'-phosphate oxidase
MDLLEINQKLNQIKMENDEHELLEKDAEPDPFEQFLHWFEEVLYSGKDDPSVMIVATVDENNLPDARIILLKELEKNRFIFYSSYDSEKGRHIAKNKVAALNFYWSQYARQVRIKGYIEKVARNKSETYFATRPREAQLCVHAWVQSTILSGRADLDNKLTIAAEKFSNIPIPCPENWGGYAVTPFEYEFFQGRKWRMHDRLRYTLHNGTWKLVRLAP